MTAVYLIFVVLCLVCCIRFDRTEVLEPEKMTHRLVLVGGLLVLITGLSYRLGGDKVIYMEQFRELDTHIPFGTYAIEQFRALSFMPLWSAVNYGAKLLFGSFYAVQLLQSLVVNGTVCYIAWRYSDRRFLVLLLYTLSGICFLFNTEVMREGFAVAFGLLAMDCHFRKRYGGFVVFFVLAVLSHLSGLILLLFPFAGLFRPNRHTLLVLCSVALVLWGGSTLILHYGIETLRDLSPALADKMILYGEHGSTVFGFGLLMIRYMIVPYLVGEACLAVCSDTTRREQWSRVLVFQLLVGAVICSMGFEFSRFQNYPRVFYLIFIAEGIRAMFVYKEFFLRKLACFSMLLYFSSMYWFSYYPITGSHFYDLYFPYTSILNEDPKAYHRIAIYNDVNWDTGATTGKRQL